MKNTKIRWAEHSWNPMTGCSKVSPGCDHCYAEVIAEKFRGAAFPAGFEPTFKPHKLREPEKWAASRVFVNSMSDVHHEAFSLEQVAEVYDRMLAVDRHDYLVLTKRPARMKAFLAGWLERHGLDEVPAHIWLGTSIESDRFVWRADRLRAIPAAVRFLSCEPLLGPLPSLDLSGIHWVIVGGESGPGYRPMDHDWARDLRNRCRDPFVHESDDDPVDLCQDCGEEYYEPCARHRGPAFYFKQSAAPRTEMGVELDGRRHEEYPLAHPVERQEA